MTSELEDSALVSILMNCYNCERYLEEAIQSVLNQTYQNWELILWDNQSKDSSSKVYKKFNDTRLKYFFSDKHTDLGGARAKAFKYLKGDYVAVLDSDDLWFPDKLEKQLKLFSNPEVGIVISDTLFFDKSNERPLYGKTFPPEGYVFKELLTRYFVSLETVVFRKKFLDKLDYGFDPEFSFIADFDLVLRVARISKLAISKEILAKWRVHQESDSWKSSISFSIEKENWIKKQIKIDDKFAKDFEKEIKALHNKNYLLIAIYSLSLGFRKKALRYILKTNLSNFFQIAVLVLCFIPFSGYFLSYMQKRRIRRLMR